MRDQWSQTLDGREEGLAWLSGNRCRLDACADGFEDGDPTVLGVLGCERCRCGVREFLRKIGGEGLTCLRRLTRNLERTNDALHVNGGGNVGKPL